MVVMSAAAIVIVVVMVMMLVLFMLMMVVMPTAAVVIVIVMVMMLVLFMLMVVVMPAAAIVIVVVMVMMLVLFVLMMVVMSTAAIVIVVMMVMMLMLFILMMVVMMSAGLFAVTIMHGDVRLIGLCDLFNRLFQPFRLTRLDAQLFGLEYHHRFFYLRQPANLRLNLARTVCTAKIFHNIDFICHANSSCPYATEYAVFKSEHMNTCSYVFVCHYYSILSVYVNRSLLKTAKVFKTFVNPIFAQTICGIINTVI